MNTEHARQFSRRRFLGGLTLAGTVGLLGWHPRPVAAEPPPETTTLKLTKTPSTCRAPQWIAEELLSELSRRPEVAGAYIICPFNRYELALTILEAVGLPK